MTTDTNPLRWMHDPAQWANFYNGASLRTFAALANELWRGRDPEHAVDAAVEGVCRNMREGRLPEDVVGAYRDENLRHRDHLVELAREIADLLPGVGKHQHREHGTAHREHHPEPIEVTPYLWGTELSAGLMIKGMETVIAAMNMWHHEMAQWLGFLEVPAAHRWHDAHLRAAALDHHYGRRSHDVDVERL